MNNNSSPLGYHYLWDIHGCIATAIEKVTTVELLLDQLCNTLNLTVLGKKSNQFAPHGATSIYLLAESHLSIHTWPENRYLALDLFSCVPIESVADLNTIFKSHLGEDIRLKETFIERG